MKNPVTNILNQPSTSNYQQPTIINQNMQQPTDSNLQTTTDQQIINTQQQTNSYANKLKQTTKTVAAHQAAYEQGIIINAIDGAQVLDYCIELGKIVEPKYITHASRISNNRISIYLSDKKIVDNIIINHNFIVVHNQKLTIRRLTIQSVRVVFSNVCPVIPNSLIEKALHFKKITPLCTISPLRAGLKHPDFAHILSFRRHTFIPEDQKALIPESIDIDYDNKIYKIFLSSDTLECVNCNKAGHTTDQCQIKKIPTNVLSQDPPLQFTKLPVPAARSTTIQQTPIAQQPTLPKLPITTPETCYPTQTTNENPIQPPTSQHPEHPEGQSINRDTRQERQTSHKRPAPSTTSSESLTTDENTKNENITNTSQDSNAEEIEQVRKQTRRSRSISPNINTAIQEILTQTKQKIETQPDKFTISYEQYKEVIENAIGSNDPLGVIRDYINNIPELIAMLKDLQPHLNTRALKNRLTRMTNRIEEQLLLEDNPLQTK